MQVGVAVITYQAEKLLERCLRHLLCSPLCPKILVVNSSSSDGTVAEARRLGAEVLVVPRAAFNHGTTREAARQQLRTPIIVMMTPDAYLEDETMLEKLVRPVCEGKAALSYARQIPHEGADFFEAFPRCFNYPEAGHIRSMEDLEKYGVYTFFCSNSCAAYCNRALGEVGGFPEVLMGEDTVVAAKLLRCGYKIAYVAEAHVRHSHDYRLKEEFRRHFDIGYMRRQHAELFDFGVKDQRRGQQYAGELLRKVMRERPWLLPYAGLHLVAKWSGYMVGRLAIRAPRAIARALSSQDFYWK